VPALVPASHSQVRRCTGERVDRCAVADGPLATGRPCTPGQSRRRATGATTVLTCAAPNTKSHTSPPPSSKSTRKQLPRRACCAGAGKVKRRTKVMGRFPVIG
jgi:hypothetical protein